MLNILKDIDKPLLDFGKDVFPYLLEKKYNLFGYKSEGDYYWQDCGYPDQLLWTNLDILQQRNFPNFPKVYAENNSEYKRKHKYRNVVIKKPVVIGKNVQIKARTKIHLSSINDNCKIGRNCTIIGSTIWENVKLGDNVKITHSIISNNVTIGDNSIIEDESVIPPGQMIPSNCHIRNGKVIQFLI